jgi:pyroglutamyl-peptidase
VKTILLTGFEPFGGDSMNPSAEAARLVAARWTGPDVLVTAVLPTEFDRGAARLAASIDDHAPDIVIATGLAGGRAAVTPERVAINLIDARIADNAGRMPTDQPSVAGGPPAYFTSLPVKAITLALTEAGIPAALSTTAGTFVCNHVFFQARWLADTRPGMRAGFIHVPFASGYEPEGAPALPLATIADALEVAVRVSADLVTDVVVPGGSLN